MINYPTVKQLRYFLALAEKRHFGRAAAACFVSQPAFSNAIRELETLLDVQLVDRTNRQVTITAVGQDVATQAGLCLRDSRARNPAGRAARRQDQSAGHDHGGRAGRRDSSCAVPARY